MTGEILDFLKMNDVEYKSGHRIAEISPIKIGGTADVIAYPDNPEKLVRLIAFLWNNKINHKIVGRMSNVLFCDEKYKGVIVRTDLINKYTVERNNVTLYCGVSLPYISGILCRAGFSGFEQISGIPGSIAGAVIGNAGAFGSEIATRLTSVTFFDYSSSDIVTLDRGEIDFSYRDSSFKRVKSVLLSAEFELTESNPSSVRSEMNRYREIRIKNQPIEMPSLGSTFKRSAENVFASKLIDECGLKGYSIGGVQISEKHAGFIVNTGGATAANYLELLEYAKKCVFEKFRVHLENEVEIIKK